MHIAWNEFTPITSLAGGVLIGLAAVMLMAGLGRIAGITGIVAGLFHPERGDWAWRALFTLGMIAAPLIYSQFSALPEITLDTDWITLLIAGLLVGIGTRLGSGCTSGHGVCGLARMSPRSVIATLAFMSSGFLTVYVVRHLF
ncbi:YeeE/YedE family protein [Undibacterium sp. WLX3042]|uniref:YeeE/YedE family protein n=1 Tax=Undibacterium sp. WLX3042 TaxID=3412686 RepID=UPI003C2DF9AF